MVSLQMPAAVTLGWAALCQEVGFAARDNQKTASSSVSLKIN
jgi:hypothetical protein